MPLEAEKREDPLGAVLPSKMVDVRCRVLDERVLDEK